MAKNYLITNAAESAEKLTVLAAIDPVTFEATYHTSGDKRGSIEEAVKWASSATAVDSGTEQNRGESVLGENITDGGRVQQMNVLKQEIRNRGLGFTTEDDYKSIKSGGREQNRDESDPTGR